MIHKPIKLHNISLQFPHKTCFEDFSAEIPYGSRIAIIGRNGSGKSTLLQVIAGLSSIHEGLLETPPGMVVGYVPQIPEGFDALSGSQRFNASLSEALSTDPDILLLDEPTNHLDRSNRKSLLRHLQNYHGTLIVVSHDAELLRTCVDTLWHIDQGKIRIFSGNYDDYLREVKLKRASIESNLIRLNRDKQEMHNKLMQEQQRASKSKAKGEKSIDQRKYPTIVSNAKAGRAQETSGSKKFAIDQRKQHLTERLEDLRLPETIVPKFALACHNTGAHTLVQISGGCVGYAPNNYVLSNINLSVFACSRVAIIGNNGSGKTTLIRAILGDGQIHKSGEWYILKPEDIGYLDQHYSTLDPELSVFETISTLAPHWSITEVRKHLNDFLFRKNEEVSALVSTLSGGERARLSLAQIATKTPKLLILDEITNNLDLETKGHVLEVLKEYPGAMVVISHDEEFLDEIGVDDRVEVCAGK